MFFGLVAMVAVVALPQLLDVAWRSAVVVAVVAVVVVWCGVADLYLWCSGEKDVWRTRTYSGF